MIVYRYVLSNPVRYRDPSGNAATEYACALEFSAGAATTIGTIFGSFISASLYSASAGLAAANGDQKRVQELVTEGAMQAVGYAA